MCIRDRDGTRVLRCGDQEIYRSDGPGNSVTPFNYNITGITITAVDGNSNRQYSFELALRYSTEGFFYDFVTVSKKISGGESELGGWGKNKRLDVLYTTPGFGPLDFPGQNTPAAGQRASIYLLSEALSKGNMMEKQMSQGQSSLVLFEDGVPVIQDQNMFQSWLRYNPAVQTIVKGKR